MNRYDGDQPFDLDASAFLLTSGKAAAESDFVFYGNASDAAGAVHYSGDNRTGEGSGDDESMLVDLTKIPATVDRISFAATIYDADTRIQNFGMVENAYIRILDQDTGEELCRYDLGEDFSTETAIVAGELYRHNGEWKFNAVGSGFSGGLRSLCSQYGINV